MGCRTPRYGGHVIAVIPSKDLVIIHRVDNGEEANVVSYRDIDTMIRMILAGASSKSDQVPALLRNQLNKPSILLLLTQVDVRRVSLAAAFISRSQTAG